MDFTASLNSQMQMLELNNSSRGNDSSLQSTDQALSHLSLQVNNNLSMKLMNNDKTLGDVNNLPTDIDSLKHMCEMRMKYTRPKHGGEWEFSNIPLTVRALRDTILFMDKNAASDDSGDNTKTAPDSTAYDRYLKPLEILPEKLESEFHTRFEDYLPCFHVVNELINMITASKYPYLARILQFSRIRGGDIPDIWLIFPNNSTLTRNDYIRYYDTMEMNMRQWLISCCIVGTMHRRNLYFTEENTSYQIIDLLISQENRSFQLYSLTKLINNNEKGAEFLNQESGFLPYLTYVSILQDAIKASLPNSRNPYETMTLLATVLKGMNAFPMLKTSFLPKLSEFITQHPNFTLGHLAEYLKDNNMPNLDGTLRITN